MAMKETVWGMIGCGDVTEKKSGPGLYKANGSRLKGCIQSHGSQGARLGATATDTVRCTQRSRSCWQTTKSRLSTSPHPPATHFDYAMQVIAANKVPLIEKPMARTFAECQTIYWMRPRETDLPVFVSFYRRALREIPENQRNCWMREPSGNRNWWKFANTSSRLQKTWTKTTCLGVCCRLLEAGKIWISKCMYSITWPITSVTSPR